MRMPRWFRRRRPAPPQIDTPALMDALTMSAWGLGHLDWRDMTDQDRAWRRDNITKAPYFPRTQHFTTN